MFFNLKRKIILLSMISVILPILIILLIISYINNSANVTIKTEINKMVKGNMGLIATSVYDLCRTADDIITNDLEKTIRIANDIISKKGSIALSNETIQWEAINQETLEKSVINLPKLTLGGQWFGKTMSVSSYVPLIDDAAKISHGTITVFQKMNSSGDMLRIATNVINKDGNRAIGTFISSKKKDGSDNPVIASVMKGEKYLGSAQVVGKWYQTIYVPLKNNSGEIIGMLYAGFSLESLKSLREAILNMKVGRTGYVYILGGNDARKGVYLISDKGKRDGENIWNSKDASGRLFIQDIVNNTVNAAPKSIYFDEYYWKNLGETEARKKIVAACYYAPFDWVIGAGAYHEEFMDTQVMAEKEINSIFNWALLTGIIISIVMIFVSIFVGNRISFPIVKAAQIMDKIADGNVKSVINDINQLESNFKPKK